MKNIKPLIAFIVCLWAAVIVTYAKQVSYDQQAHAGRHLSQAEMMQQTVNCSSSSSSSGE